MSDFLSLSLTSLQLSTGESNGTPLQYSCLENPMDGGAWWAAVHGVTKSWTRLNDFTFTFHFYALEKGMATHFCILIWTKLVEVMEFQLSYFKSQKMML